MLHTLPNMDEEESNCWCLVLLLYRVGNPCLRLYFKNKWDATGTYTPWTDCAQNGADLLRMFIPLHYEKKKVQSGDTSKWDLPLFAKVLLHSQPPFVRPSVIAPDLVTALKTLQELRNDFCHSPLPRITTPNFQKAWTDACAALSLFGADADDFVKVKEDVTKPWNELYLMLKHCVDQDKDMSDKLDLLDSQMQQLLKGQDTILEGQSSLQQGQDTILESQNTIQEGQSRLQEGQDTILERLTALSSLKQSPEEMRDSHTNAGMVPGQGRKGQKRSITEAKSEEDIGVKVPRIAPCGDNREQKHAQDSKNLKEAIKNKTQYQPKLMASNDINSTKTDNIFTDLMVYHDRTRVKKEQSEDTSRRKHLKDYIKRSSYKVKKCQDIFIDSEGENPKRLVLLGKPGIGKSLFCQKLIRDWAHDQLFENESIDFQFTYLLTFRQLSLLGDKEMNLRELLNCSAVLNEHSIIDGSLFEYFTKNPSKVLIILDGYDEYSKQHRNEMAGDFEKKYPNNPREKMPIPALCSKLIKGSFLNDSVVLISSRPGEAEADLEINNDFNRFVEISGFSPEQVTEFVGKYFGNEPQKEETKNTVLEHITNNENLLSFCHIPLLSFLLCGCLEWQITQSGNTNNFPAKITDLYYEVVEVFVQKLHANLKHATKNKQVMKTEAQQTLAKLARLAAYLLKKGKYIFDEKDMKKLKLTVDEIENLKVSGILYCIPGIRTSAFETKNEYSFTHLTLQEYLSASFFVKKKKIRKLLEKKKTSGQTFVFMAGLLSREKDEKQMKILTEEIEPHDIYDNLHKLLTLECLYEYGDDELSKLTIRNLHGQYYDSNGEIEFRAVTDMDVKHISYLLDIIRLLQEQHPQSPGVHTLRICDSPLNLCGFGVVCESLVRNLYITELQLSYCMLDNKCVVDKMMELLVNTKLTTLALIGNNIMDKGVENICKVLTESKLRDLHLQHNNITDKGVESICKVLTESKLTTLDLSNNNAITDKGVESICTVLTESKLTALDLSLNKITDKGVEMICTELTASKLTHLELSDNNIITDKGVKSICTVLAESKLTTLHLSSNNITDKGVDSICAVLAESKLTTLDLSDNNITDKGVESICRVLTKSKLTTFDLSCDDITDKGVESICTVLAESKLTTLDLSENNITDKGVESICRVLTKSKLTTLDLSDNNLTDKGVESICTVLAESNLTTLHLRSNDITDKGVESICTVLAESKLTNLELSDNNITDKGVESICTVLTESKLTHLDLVLCDDITDKGVESICRVLAESKLTTLDLSCEDITDEGVERICRVLIESKLTTLDLSDNDDITDKGVESICRVLIETKLTSLDLSYNNDITDKGVESICRVLAESKLTTLDLSDNNDITDKGVESICTVLTASKLTTLDLSNNNDITDKGVESICRVLTESKLTHLDISYNNITDKGVESICRVLTESKLTLLDISYNNITDEGVKSICRVLILDKCCIERIYLRDNNNNITDKCKIYARAHVEQHKPAVCLLI